MPAVFQPILISVLVWALAPASEPPPPDQKAVPDRVRKAIQATGGDELPTDPRINVEKITELPVPSVPTTVVLPTPPVHRIAVDRSETRLDEATWTSGRTATRRGLAWLESMQSRRGGWMEGAEVIATDQPPREAAAAVAVTGLGLKAFAQAPALADSPLTMTRAARARSCIL